MSCTLLRGARLYTPQEIGVGDLLVCEGKIAAIAPSLDSVRLPDLTVIDASGKRLLPGLIDQHVHLTGGGGESSFQSRIPELTLPDCTTAGVTTAVGVLGTDSLTRSPENLLAKAKGLTEQGITVYCLTGSYSLPSPTITGSVKKDIVFIGEILGVKLAISDHRGALPSARELARLALDVRQAALLSGKAGVVHLHIGGGKAGLSPVFEALELSDVPIRHFRPTHMENAFSDALRFAGQGGYIDFTADEDLPLVAKTLLRAFSQTDPALISLSSDAGGSIPVWNEKKELIGIGIGRMHPLLATVRELIVTHHMPAEQALSIVTKNVAKALLLPEKGELFVGADADLLLADADWRIDSVYAKGRPMVQDGKPVSLGYFSSQGVL